MTEPNALYYGDNLDVLLRHVTPSSVDLVYLDPPFQSGRDYNLLFQEKDGTRAAAQIKAFEDTWEWNTDSANAYQQVVEAGGDVAKAMVAFRTLLGGSDMLAYLSMMAPRLVALRDVLKPTGSIFLHCDPTASHYLKLLMDAVFRPANFVNEIIWHYRKWPTGSYTFQRNHDVILFYSRTGTRERAFNQLFMERAPSTLKRFGKARITSGHDEGGRRTPSTTTGEESEGVRMDDVWDIGRVPPIKQLFPTEKPADLLARIISAASNPGDLILDPFCGCGTAVVVAQALGRKWIGVDITHLSIGLIKHRLAETYGPEISTTYRVVGEPTTAEDAAVLAKEDPFQFQAWALGLVGARVAGSDKKGGDKGIDGRLYFHDSINGPTRQIVFSVKAGHLVPSFVRDLSGVLTREGAEIGVLISFEESTSGMRTEAADSGFYESPWGKHPRIQLLTIRELLDGKIVDYPHVTGGNVTHRKSARAQTVDAEPIQLFAAEDPAPYGDVDGE